MPTKQCNKIVNRALPVSQQTTKVLRVKNPRTQRWQTAKDLKQGYHNIWMTLRLTKGNGIACSVPTVENVPPILQSVKLGLAVAIGGCRGANTTSRSKNAWRKLLVWVHQRPKQTTNQLLKVVHRCTTHRCVLRVPVGRTKKQVPSNAWPVSKINVNRSGSWRLLFL